MGKVFTYEEIVVGQVPSGQDFNDSGQVFLESADAAIQGGAVEGAFIYGSVALGLANQRSDFDVFIATTDSSREAYAAAQEIVHAVETTSDRRVPVSAIVQPRQSLTEGRHEMDRFFGRHLSSKYRIIRGDDPALYIEYPQTPPETILGNYLFHKRRRLTNAYVAGSPLETKDGNGIQRMLELPQAVGRKALHALLEAGHKVNAVKKSADKVEVIKATDALMDQEGLREVFDQLLVLDYYYSSLVEDTIAGYVNQATYEASMVALHEQLPTAITWLDKVERTLLPKFKD